MSNPKKAVHPPHDTSHGSCGKTWKQRGNKTGHCSGCHETFEGLGLFDAHRYQISENERGCKSPEKMEYPKGWPLKLENGSWRSTKPYPERLYK